MDRLYNLAKCEEGLRQAELKFDHYYYATPSDAPGFLEVSSKLLKERVDAERAYLLALAEESKIQQVLDANLQ